MEIYCTDCKRDDFLPDISIHNFGGSSSVYRMSARERQGFIKGEDEWRRMAETRDKRETSERLGENNEGER